MAEAKPKDPAHIYAVISVIADVHGSEHYTVEALCFTPAKAFELRKALLASGVYIRRAFVSANVANTLNAMVESEDDALVDPDGPGAQPSPAFGPNGL